MIFTILQYGVFCANLVPFCWLGYKLSLVLKLHNYNVHVNGDVHAHIKV